MPELLDFSEFCKDLPEVTTSKIIDKRKFHINGLFSEQIFGPIKNYTCQCGKFYGISQKGTVCKICNVEAIKSTERRNRFAKIKLPIKVINPIFYDLVLDVFPSNVKKMVESLKEKDDTFLCISKDGIFIETDSSKIPEDVERLDGLDAIYKVIEYFTDNYIKNKIGNTKNLTLIKNNLDKLLIDNIIVLPPDLRPASKCIVKNTKHKADKINEFYVQILNRIEVINSTIQDMKVTSKTKETYYKYYKPLQKEVDQLYTKILEKLAKKEGLIRGNILGKRIDFSGRAVIVPDPTLRLDECVLPYIMVLELFKLQIAKRLLEKGIFKLLNQAIDFIDDCIEKESYVLSKITKEIVKGEVCLLNRQPSLHRLNMLGFKIKTSTDSIIKVHPLICSPFNADFDGDQMAVYIPINEESKQEILDKFLVTKNFTNPSNGSLTTTPSQDIILGIYMLSTNSFSKLNHEVEYKGKLIPYSMKLINDCFPKDYPLINTIIRKKELIEILNNIKDSYDEETTLLTLDSIKMLGYKYSTLYGCSLSLSSFKVEGLSKFRDSLYTGTVGEQLNKVSSKETEDELKKNFKYAYMIDSGARGSWDQVRQIILTRGFISNFQGKILPTPIKHSLLEGLTEQEFFNSTYGCRKGLLDVALNTGTSGYLSRKLIFACINLQLSNDCTDCGTEDFLSVYVKSYQKAKMLIGKYYLNGSNLDLITKDNYKSLINKTIKVRSIIYCKSENICHTCYGKYKNLHSKFIGVIAAQALGECNTQLILRTFHTSGVAITKGSKDDNGMKQMDIVADLSSVSKLLHHVNNKDCNTLVDELFDVYNNSRAIYHVHFEAVVSQLMWIGDRKWRLIGNSKEDKEEGVTRKQVKPEFYSIQSIPSKESWLMGLSFSNPRKHILKGILESGNYTGIIDKILCGEKIN